MHMDPAQGRMRAQRNGGTGTLPALPLKQPRGTEGCPTGRSTGLYWDIREKVQDLCWVPGRWACARGTGPGSFAAASPPEWQTGGELPQARCPQSDLSGS